MSVADTILFSLDEVAKIVTKNKGKCSCGYLFKAKDIRYYDHSKGIPVADKESPQWIYFVCNKCYSEEALWKVLNRIAIEKQLELPFNEGSFLFLKQLHEQDSACNNCKYRKYSVFANVYYCDHPAVQNISKYAREINKISCPKEAVKK